MSLYACTGVVIRINSKNKAHKIIHIFKNITKNQHKIYHIPSTILYFLEQTNTISFTQYYPVIKYSPHIYIYM